MRKHLGLLALVSICVLLAGCPKREGQTPDGTVTVSSTATATAPGPPPVASPLPIRILVLGDGFADDPTFQPFVDRIRADLTRKLPGAAADGSSFDVRLRALPFVKGKSQLSPLKYHGKEKKCYFTINSTVLGKVAAQSVPNFAPQRYLVILNKDGGAGCAQSPAAFLNKDSSPDVLIHEMGHSLAGLYDEIGGKTSTPLKHHWRNCTSDAAHPPWSTQEGGAVQYCDHYQALFRPARDCKMNSPGTAEFCKVCIRHVKCAVEKGELGGCVDGPVIGLPASLRQDFTQGLDVLAVVSGKHLEVQSAYDVQLDSVLPQIITGDTFAVVYDGTRTAGVASLSMDDESLIRTFRKEIQFTARSYGPDGSERIVPVDARLVRMVITGLTAEEILTNKHDLKFDFRQLEDARSSFILNDATVAKLASPPAEEPYQLQTALRNYLLNR
jgi:hypothetical protein